MEWITEFQQMVGAPVTRFAAEFWLPIIIIAALGLWYWWNDGWGVADRSTTEVGISLGGDDDSSDSGGGDGGGD